jgi:hypothetical protein
LDYATPPGASSSPTAAMSVADENGFTRNFDLFPGVLSDGSQIECPQKTHEGVDEQLAALRARIAVMVAVFAFDR